MKLQSSTRKIPTAAAAAAATNPFVLSTHHVRIHVGSVSIIRIQH